MQAIVFKFHGPAVTKGARISATAPVGKLVSADDSAGRDAIANAEAALAAFQKEV